MGSLDCLKARERFIGEQGTFTMAYMSLGCFGDHWMSGNVPLPMAGVWCDQIAPSTFWKQMPFHAVQGADPFWHPLVEDLRCATVIYSSGF